MLLRQKYFVYTHTSMFLVVRKNKSTKKLANQHLFYTRKLMSGRATVPCVEYIAGVGSIHSLGSYCKAIYCV